MTAGACTPARSRPSVDDYARAIADGLAALVRRARPRRRRHRRGPPRHDGRLERHPRAQRRPHRPDHDQGLPRRPRDPQSAHAAALRHRLDQAAAAGRAPPAGRGRRAHGRARRGAAPARPGGCRARRPQAPRRGRRGDRGVPAELLRQSGSRAPDQADRRSSSHPICPSRSAPRCCPRSRNTSAPRARSSTPM